MRGNHTSSLDGAIARFIHRAGLVAGMLPVAVLDNPTEELLDTAQRGGSVALFARGLRKKKSLSKSVARLEENYLYSSRRFPTGTNNTIGSGALAVNTYPFFNKAAGDDGSGVGFPTGYSLDLRHTNMELAGQIAQGTSFVFNQIGVSFNSDAATADVAQLMEAAVLQFTKAGGQFTLNHGPVKMWPSGMGVDGYAAYGTTAATTTVRIEGAHNGASDIRAVRHLRIARVIREKETFAYNFVIPSTTKSQNGTAFGLSDFVIATVWLWGAQKNVIPN